MRAAAHPALQHVESRPLLERFHFEAIVGTQEGGDAFGIAGRRAPDADARRRTARRRTGRELELLADKPINGAWLAVQESPCIGQDRREHEASLCLSAAGARWSLPTINDRW